MGHPAANEILQRLQGRDTQFIAELQTIVQRIAQKWNWTEYQSVDDIAQDCMVKILTNLSGGRFEGRSSFKTYVYTIVRRTCIDYYRAARAVEAADIEHVTLVDESDTPEEKVLNDDRRRTAARVLLALPKDCRQLWRTIFMGRRNYRQAADLLGLKEGTVKRRMWECRQMARQSVAAMEK
ncbi:MAG: sigma-70 family RNA polymerase sigma factor [bacterium]